MRLSVLAVIFVSIVFSLKSQTFTKLAQPVFSSNTADWYSAVPVDIDNNYTLDLVIANNGADAFFLHADSLDFSYNTSKNFVNQTGSATGSYWADIDNDCDLDVVWPSRTGTVSYVYENTGNGTFTRLTSSTLATDLLYGNTAAWGDYDNDGLVDLFVCRAFNGQGLINYLYRNNGNFSFTRIDTGVTAQVSAVSAGVSWVDFDNDNDLDLFVANRDGVNNEFYINRGNGTFRKDSTSIIVKDSANSSSCSWGDYDNDGFQDLFVANVIGEKNHLYKNNGNGTFTKILTGPIVNDQLNSVASIWTDFDNDGYLDLFVGHNGQLWAKNNILYKNNGNGTFSKVTSGPQFSDVDETFAVTAADLNTDGFVDLIVPNRYNGPVAIYLNDGNTNGYIHLNLHGSTSNRSAIGARVVAISALGKQTRTITQQTGLNQQDDMSIKFGFGADTIIDSLTIFWPSGGTCIFTNVAPKGFYNVMEGTCSLDSFPKIEFHDSTRFLTAHFNNLSSGAVGSFEWDFGDGTSSTQTNPTHHYTQAGKYEVTLTGFDNFCKFITIKDSIEICPDTAKLGFYTSHQGVSVTFTDTSVSNGYAFQWDFDDGNTGTNAVTSHTYATAGLYNVCLFVTDSCRIDTVCQTITVCNDTLTADFGYSASAFNASFVDASINSSSLVWNFGDGQSSTSTNPTHTYASPGYYTVCQTAIDVCTSTTTCKTIGICLDTAVANFSFVDNINTVSFTSTAQHASTHSWDFGDGNTSSSINPTYTYQQPGTYTVCLTVTNDCYTDTLCQTVSVCLNTTKASFNYSDTLTTVSFNSTSSNATSYLWDFGDGSFSTLQNPTYTYQQYGTYTICLVTSNNCGSDTTCKTINVCPKVAVADYSSHHLGGLNMKFYQLCTNAVSYMWDFGDGNYSASANPSYAFNSAWFFTVCLTATDSCGKTDTYCEEIDLHEFSINELALLELIKVYPNPASDYVYIELPEELTQNASVTTSDVQGKILATQPLENTTTSKIDISQYASGIYIINLQLSGASKQVKVRKE